MNSENSALTALSELRNLEANRVASEESDRVSKEQAERHARDEAERRAREDAERIARAQAEEFARQQAEQEAREREERIRIHEADVRARAEQEARLREEQMRLDAQMKIAEKKAKPKWPLLVVPVLVVGLGVAGYMVYQSTQAAERERAAHEAQIAGLTAKMDALAAEQDKLESSKADLDKRLSAAQTDAERAKLIAEKQELELQIAKNAEAQAVAEQTAADEGVKAKPEVVKKKPAGSSTPKKPAADAPDPVSGRRDKLDVNKGDDPLSGL